MIVGPNYQRRSKDYLAIVSCWLFSKVKINTNNFRSKDAVTHILTSGVVYKFPCAYRGSARHFEVRSGEHIGISPLTNK